MADEKRTRKAILLAGGAGTRLFPATRAVSKQLLPVYDKPMVYYPLSVLMLAGIRDILLISTPQDIGSYQRLLGDGSQLGVSIRYCVQPRPEGVAQAFILAREFVGHDQVALVLGDNIFYGQGFQGMLMDAASREGGATVFVHRVNDPGRYGIIEMAADGTPIQIVEKPEKPESNYVVTGLYFYDNQVLDIAAAVRPSARGELEITDVNQEYLRRKQLRVEFLGRGFAWFDPGTHESLLEAANFVESIEKRQGLKIACIEEIAYRKGFVSAEQLRHLAAGQDNRYGRYLLGLLETSEVDLGPRGPFPGSRPNG